MRNEWRDNIWMIVSLTVVTAAVWVLLTIIYMFVQGLFAPRGFNVDNVYSLNVRMVEEGSPYYVDVENPKETRYSDFGELLRRLRRNPDVESVAFHWGALPYSYDFYGQQVNVVGVSDSILYFANCRSGSPDIVKVMKLESLTGATEEQLVEMLRKGEILISSSESYESAGRNPLDLKGKMVYLGGDSTKQYRVGDVIRTVRRSDYELLEYGTVIEPLSEDRPWGCVAVRVKPGKEKSFEKNFREDESLRRLRNVFLTELKSMDSVRRICQRSADVNVRQSVGLIVFVLVTVFLGLLGTFWFRVQQRESEISIRIVFGATARDIFGRIISEGMILLMLATLLASAIIWSTVVPWFINASGLEWSILLVTELAAVLLVASGILLSLLYPAMKAMRVEPALGIKSE